MQVDCDDGMKASNDQCTNIPSVIAFAHLQNICRAIMGRAIDEKLP